MDKIDANLPQINNSLINTTTQTSNQLFRFISAKNGQSVYGGYPHDTDPLNYQRVSRYGSISCFFELDETPEIEIDYGDGTIINYVVSENNQQNTRYVIWFSTLDGNNNWIHSTNYSPDGGVTGNPYYTNINGDAILPITPHFYEDNTARIITVYINKGKLIWLDILGLLYIDQFPVLELPYLQNLRIDTHVGSNANITDGVINIPYSSFIYNTNLKIIQLSVGDKFGDIISSAFNQQLTNLAINYNYDPIYDVNDTNLRNIRNCINLNNIQIVGPKQFFKELNELPNIGIIYCPYSDRTEYIDISEIDELFPNINSSKPVSVYVNTYAYGSDQGKYSLDKKTQYRYNFVKFIGKGLNRIRILDWVSNRGYTIKTDDGDIEIEESKLRYVDLPEECVAMLNDMYNLVLFFQGTHYRLPDGLTEQQQQDRIDSVIDVMYKLCTENGPMSPTRPDGNRNQYYNVSCNMTDGGYNDVSHLLPSGSYEAPEGFIEGENNGNPTTAAQKLYCLVKNYHHNWTFYESYTEVTREAINPKIANIRNTNKNYILIKNEQYYNILNSNNILSENNLQIVYSTDDIKEMLAYIELQNIQQNVIEYEGYKYSTYGNQ